MEKGIFDQMTEFVKILIVGSLYDPVFSGRNNSRHPLRHGQIDNCITIMAAISQKMLRFDPFDQTASLRAIRSGTFRDNDSNRHTMRIHGQMYLGVEPPFVRLIS